MTKEPPKLVKEVIINGLLSVGLFDDGRVHAIVAGKPVIYCVHVLITAAKEGNANITYSNAGSIDEIITDVRSVTNTHDDGMTGESDIDVDTALVGHASNIQAWAEMGYDARFMQAAVARPILKALADNGDTRAVRAYNASILERWVAGTYESRKALIEYNNTEVLALVEDDQIDRDSYDAIKDALETYLTRTGASPALAVFVLNGDRAYNAYHDAMDDDDKIVHLPPTVWQLVEDSGGFSVAIRACSRMLMSCKQSTRDRTSPIDVMRTLRVPKFVSMLDMVLVTGEFPRTNGEHMVVGLFKYKRWEFEPDVSGTEWILFKGAKLAGRNVLKEGYEWRLVNP